MNFLIRTFLKKDYLPVLGFLNSNLDFDRFDEKLLHEKLEGDPYWQQEKTLICYEHDRIIGFMQGVLREIEGKKLGYIKLMAVMREYRRQGIATALFEQLTDLFKKDGVSVVRIYDSPMNYLMPGIDPRYTEAVCFALRMGFKRFADTSNLLVDLYSDAWETIEEEASLNEHDIIICRPDFSEKNEVLEFVQKNWTLWEYEVRRAFENNPPSIHIARLRGEIKAFSAHEANNKGMGWFGPMGTHPDLRGKGIGGILLKRCLLDMKKSGYQKAIIPWVGPIDFYAHHAGARVDRVFWRFEKHFE